MAAMPTVKKNQSLEQVVETLPTEVVGASVNVTLENGKAIWAGRVTRSGETITTNLEKLDLVPGISKRDLKAGKPLKVKYVFEDAAGKPVGDPLEVDTEFGIAELVIAAAAVDAKTPPKVDKKAAGKPAPAAGQPSSGGGSQPIAGKPAPANRGNPPPGGDTAPAQIGWVKEQMRLIQRRFDELAQAGHAANPADVTRITEVEKQIGQLATTVNTVVQPEVAKLRSELNALKNQMTQLSTDMGKGFADSKVAADEILKQVKSLTDTAGGDKDGKKDKGGKPDKGDSNRGGGEKSPGRLVDCGWFWGTLAFLAFVLGLAAIVLGRSTVQMAGATKATPALVDNTANTESLRAMHAVNDNVNQLREQLAAKERAAYTPPPLPAGVKSPVSGAEPPKGATTATATAPQAPAPAVAQTPANVVTQIVNVYTSTSQPSRSVYGDTVASQRDVVEVRRPPQRQVVYQQEPYYGYQQSQPVVVVPQPVVYSRGYYPSSSGYYYNNQPVQSGWSKTGYFLGGVLTGVVADELIRGSNRSSGGHYGGGRRR